MPSDCDRQDSLSILLFFSIYDPEARTEIAVFRATKLTPENGIGYFFEQLDTDSNRQTSIEKTSISAERRMRCGP